MLSVNVICFFEQHITNVSPGLCCQEIYCHFLLCYLGNTEKVIYSGSSGFETCLYSSASCHCILFPFCSLVTSMLSTDGASYSNTSVVATIILITFFVEIMEVLNFSGINLLLIQFWNSFVRCLKSFIVPYFTSSAGILPGPGAFLIF